MAQADIHRGFEGGPAGADDFHVERVGRGRGDGTMEFHVQRHVILSLVQFRFHSGAQPSKPLDRTGVTTGGGQRRHRNFQAAAHLKHMVRASLPGHQRMLKEMPQHPPAHAADARGTARRDIDQPESRQRARRLAHDGAADPQHARDLSLAGQPVARPHAVAGDVATHIGDDLPGQSVIAIGAREGMLADRHEQGGLAGYELFQPI